MTDCGDAGLLLSGLACDPRSHLTSLFQMPELGGERSSYSPRPLAKSPCCDPKDGSGRRFGAVSYGQV